MRTIWPTAGSATFPERRDRALDPGHSDRRCRGRGSRDVRPAPHACRLRRMPSCSTGSAVGRIVNDDFCQQTLDWWSRERRPRGRSTGSSSAPRSSSQQELIDLLDTGRRRSRDTPGQGAGRDEAQSGPGIRSADPAPGRGGGRVPGRVPAGESPAGAMDSAEAKSLRKTARPLQRRLRGAMRPVNSMTTTTKAPGRLVR